jgi:hypothetical protein
MIFHVKSLVKYENRVLWRILGSNVAEMNRRLRKSHKEKLKDNCSITYIRMIKWRTFRWEEKA